MNTYCLYHRYPGGTIEYLGPCQWDSLEDLLEYSQRADREPETEQMAGWKHSTVVWYGDMGIGVEDEFEGVDPADLNDCHDFIE